MWWTELQGAEVSADLGPDGRSHRYREPDRASEPRAHQDLVTAPVLPSTWSWLDTALCVAWLALDWVLSRAAGAEWLDAVRWRDGL